MISVRLTCLATVAAAVLPALGTSAEVEVRRHAFRPATVSVAVGDAVNWSFADADPHTVTGAPISMLEPLDSPALITGGRFSRTFRNPGTYEYLCAVHPTMTGAVVVTGSGGALPGPVVPPVVDPPAPSPGPPPAATPSDPVPPPSDSVPVPSAAPLPAPVLSPPAPMAAAASSSPGVAAGAEVRASAGEPAAGSLAARPSIATLVGLVRIDGSRLRLRVRAAVSARVLVRSVGGRVRRSALVRGPGDRSLDLRGLPAGGLVVTVTVRGARGVIQRRVEIGSRRRDRR